MPKPKTSTAEPTAETAIPSTRTRSALVELKSDPTRRAHHLTDLPPNVAVLLADAFERAIPATVRSSLLNRPGALPGFAPPMALVLDEDAPAGVLLAVHELAMLPVLRERGAEGIDAPIEFVHRLGDLVTANVERLKEMFEPKGDSLVKRVEEKRRFAHLIEQEQRGLVSDLVAPTARLLDVMIALGDVVVVEELRKDRDGDDFVRVGFALASSRPAETP